MNQKPILLIVSDWIRRDLHEPLRHFKEFKIVHLYRQAGYQDMKAEDFENPRATQWHSPLDLWQKIVAAEPDILQGGEPWANRSSLTITLVTWWYKRTHPQVKLVWPSMENRPLSEKFSLYERSLLSWWGKIYGSSSDLVMYLNQGARTNLIKVGIPPSKLRHVMWATWGIDCGEFSPKPSHTYTSDVSRRRPPAGRAGNTTSDVGHKGKIILFVGKISEAKGVPWLLKAFQDIRSKIKDVKLVLAGPLDKKSKFQIPNSKNIEYLGIVKNQDLPPLFRQAEVVVAPSITTKTWAEQVGMVNLQAMACGIPVITTRSGAIPEFVKDGEGTILVPERDSQAIAGTIVKLLTDSKLYSATSKKARQYVCGRYEVKKNINQVEKLLLNLASSLGL